MQNEPPAELVEIAARVLAPFMEGGREFDQMPPDRIALRKWCREGMCSTNDATQDDALEAATAVLAAVTPQIEARAREEGAKAMQAKAVKVAAWAHMVPPDGGSPSEEECAVARAAADAIAALDPAQIAGGEK